ncbi:MULTISPECIES: riboflavin synthase [unclassified Sedimentibacter]|uniref:riboflavin synthase n=1 Tax=unclassified Sedimentibacter TaxID=2649220 RepID=UPI0027E1B52B|nr:riboflavin synthase [Sedimentibacter sp. MB35-C1]WMJ77896.1 riboflavin synthase [Sedimentibacter sp. MB35-C1]
MFTGIIEEIGNIQGIRKGKDSAKVTVKAFSVLEDANLGDSISVNGVCLTITSFSQNSFIADVMHETLNRSSLGTLRAGSPVNLERAMPANGRFGGHIVSGHIDGIGTISSITKDDNATWYTIKTSPNILRYIIEKGSIAIDGISLTVAKVHKESFSVSVIPHTATQTILSEKRTGDIVNLENDCIGKYVERLMNAPQSTSNITAGFLAKHGF